MPDYVPVHLTCLKTGKDVSSEYCAKECKHFRGTMSSPEGLYITCLWKDHELTEEHKKSEALVRWRN